VVSTVPTLAAMWPVEALDTVRLLILAAKACSPELAARLAGDNREVWNTTAPPRRRSWLRRAVTGDGPVRIGLPLAGWDLAVVGPDGLRSTGADRRV